MRNLSTISLIQSVIMSYLLYFLLSRIKNPLNIEQQVSSAFFLTWSFWQTVSKILAQLF